MKNFKQLTQVLTESASYVGSTTGDKNILTKNGFKNIIADKTLSKEYVNRLTEGFSADHREVLGSLMEQTIAQAVLQEAYDTLSPFQALSLPLLRVLWPYNSLKDGIQTIVATSPTFLLTAKHYYLVKRNKETGAITRYELPQHSAMIADQPHGQLAGAVASVGITLPNDVETPTNLALAGALNAVTPEVNFKIGTANVHGLTTDIQVTEIAFGANKKIAIPKHGWNTGKNIVLPFNDVVIAEAVAPKVGEVSFTGSIILLPSLELGKVQAILTGAYTASGTDALEVLGTIDSENLVVKVKGSVSERWNENHMSFEYQTENFSITIPDGKRVSSPLPVELVQDVKNLYQLDAASEFGTGMRMLFGDAFDIEGVNFFKETIEAAYPGALAIAKTGASADQTAANHIPIKIFNTMPQVGYMGDLVQWRANTMKDLIRMITSTLEKEWYIKYGKVTLFANPIDGDLLHGVDWTFEPGVAAEGEVTADYGIGTFRTAGRMYKLITSQRVEEGVIWVLLTPSEADVMTLRYYPYYFGLETGNGYRDANYSNVPSVTYIRRHKFEKYIPALGALVIQNNNGFPNYAGFNYK